MNKLDEAKTNLKMVLDRLEKSIQDNLKSNNAALIADFENLKKANQNYSLEILKLKASLDDRNSEINHLREENFQIQAELGKERERSVKLEAKNNEASRRVDMIISEFKNYITNHA
ncbi:MAG: hypothetical protein SFT90_05640 [Rickettsiales bacterium]|nr:hypothetical protein [Rickettsiales bacterium]